MFQILKRLKAREYGLLVLITGLITLLVWLELEIPSYMEELTPLIAAKAPLSSIWKIGGKMLLCAFGVLLSTIVMNFCSAKLAAGFSKRLRKDIFYTIEGFSLEQIQKFSTASLITRSTNDVTQIQGFLSMGIHVLIRSPITAIWALCKISSAAWQSSVATAGAVVVLIITIAIAVSLAMPRFKKMQTLTDNINRVARENLEGVRVVRAYNAEGFEGQKFEKANDALTKNSTFAGRVMSIMNPMMSFINTSLSIVIYWIGSVLINKAVGLESQQIVFGQTIAFSSMAMQVVMSFMLLTMVFVMLPRASVSAKRINEILTTPSTIVGGEFDGNTKEKGTVEFKNVNFCYPDAEENVLENISFSVKKGQSVAFIGSTGSGKSTLINLIPRFYDISAGQILVDGVDIKDYQLPALRNKIGYISQRAVMFSGSVKENLLFGETNKPDATDEQLDEVLKVSCADFVENMEGGKDAYIAQGGTNVSGGQKQRLSIARGLARDPEILIFDDTFSALDYKTDKKLRANLKAAYPNTTKLIVAQRIGTIKDCDQIVVLDNGRMVGIGKHKDLLKNCEIYKEIALSQLSKEEL